MWAFRLAVSWLAAGLVVSFFVIHRNDSMESLIEYLKESETWVAIGLLVLLGGFAYLRVPRMVTKMLDDRAGAISKELAEAKRLREEALAVLAGYVQKAAHAELEAARIVSDAKEEAERFAKETRAQLRQQIERRAQIAKDKIEQAEQAALEEIRVLAADKAVAAAEKLITERLDSARSDALVADSIQDFNKAG
jgi:F-type H+-transporting ATPase subunit b